MVWLIKSGKSGLVEQPPVLILKSYNAVPREFPQNDSTDIIFADISKKLVYDIMCNGIVEIAVDAEWLSDYIDIDNLS